MAERILDVLRSVTYRACRRVHRLFPQERLQAQRHLTADVRHEFFVRRVPHGLLLEQYLARYHLYHAAGSLGHRQAADREPLPAVHDLAGAVPADELLHRLVYLYFCTVDLHRVFDRLLERYQELLCQSDQDRRFFRHRDRHDDLLPVACIHGAAEYPCLRQYLPNHVCHQYRRQQ